MLEIEDCGNGRFALAGRLDAAQVDRAKAALGGATGTVVVDLARLDYISSAGLGLMIALHQRLSAGGGSLRIASPNALVRNVFRLSRLDQLIAVE